MKEQGECFLIKKLKGESFSYNESEKYTIQIVAGPQIINSGKKRHIHGRQVH